MAKQEDTPNHDNIVTIREQGNALIVAIEETKKLAEIFIHTIGNISKDYDVDNPVFTTSLSRIMEGMGASIDEDSIEFSGQLMQIIKIQESIMWAEMGIN